VKARLKLTLVLLAVAGGGFAYAGAIDDVRDAWRDVKAQAREIKAGAKEVIGMRGSSSGMGCPMMDDGGMMGGGMMGGGMMGGGMMGGGMMGGAPNEQWRGPERGTRR